MSKKTNKNDIEQESGRSMVEMLGVLAIIGVLSVGGISGYTTAMNKHKANEILNAAAIRAMVVSTQLQNGAETPTLGEFTDNTVGNTTFKSTVDVDDTTGRFTIGFTSGPSTEVLKQIENIAGTDGIVRAITSGGLTYNKDLSADKIPSDFTYDTCPSNFVKCGKTNSCVATAADCQCPTHATDNVDSCTCNAGYTGPKCDICDEDNGYESDGNGGCKKAGYTFKILGTDNWTHPEAYNACLDEGMELATIQIVLDAMPGCTDKYQDGAYEGCDISQLQYTDDTEGKLGDGRVYYAWLNECWTKGSSAALGDECPASYYKGENKHNKMDPENISGSAWYVISTGALYQNPRGGYDPAYALCVKDS